MSIVLYMVTIIAANWAVLTFGFVPVGFGLMAPAGVFFAGLAFTFRDLTQDTYGRGATFAAIILGSVVSFALSPGLAVASAAAFLFSETADMLVYTPIKRRQWLTAIVASNIVGLTIDSALFLWLAFGSLEFLPGQILGKTYMTILAVFVLWVMKWWRNRLSTTRYAT